MFEASHFALGPLWFSVLDKLRLPIDLVCVNLS